jgi:L-lactate dehydrogenase
VFLKHTGLPQERVIGSGTILDTARLRARVAEYYDVNQKNVHAYVLGEHGDSSFVPWSIANISNVPVESYRNAILNKVEYPEFKRDEVENYVRKSGARVIQRKGATFYAVSVSVCHVIQCLLKGIDTTLTVSTMLNGEYGISDVCLSLPAVVGGGGIIKKIYPNMTEPELGKLRASADALKKVIASLDMN